MATYNIYTYKNGEESDEPSIIVELNEDDTEIVSVTSANPENQEEDEKSIRHYVELGATPIGAIKRYAGPYDQVWNADEPRDAEVEADAEPEAEVEAPAESEVEEEGVVSAVEETSANALPGPAGQIMSGAPMAMVSDAGIVATMFRTDEEGTMFIRSNGDWQPVANPDNLSELSFVGVQEEALSLYDQRVSEGYLAPIKYYPASPDGPYWTEAVDDVSEAPEDSEDVESEESEEESFTASIVLNSARDLDIAIAAAVMNPDLRWFVERRVAALGLEAALPWQKG